MIWSRTSGRNDGPLLVLLHGLGATDEVYAGVEARGEHDPMVTGADLVALVDDPIVLPGLGHNAHVEEPSAIVVLARHLPVSERAR